MQSVRLLHGLSSMGYHHKFMPFIWSIFSDISIFMAYYKYKQYTQIIHAIGGILICVISIATSLPTFLKKGIPAFDSPMRMHYIFGILLYGVMALQMILGILIRVMRYYPKSTTIILLKLNKMHKYVGLTLALLSKLQVLKILPTQGYLFWFNLLWNIIAICLYYKRSLAFPQLQQNTELTYNKYEIRQISSYSEITRAYPNSIIYGNFIFNGDLIKHRHPAGFQIIQAVKGKCIERYLFGMHTSQINIDMSAHAHSFRSIQLLGKPIAKLNIPQLYIRQQKQVKVCIDSIQIVAPNSQIYQVILKLYSKDQIQYTGLTDLRQFGRYYSLTINHKTTRLYSILNFLRTTNISLMQKIFKNVKLQTNNISQSQRSLKHSNEYLQMKTELSETKIPILMKLYKNGRLTYPFLNQHQIKHIFLSVQKGRGLQFDEIDGDHIVIVAGGTGLFPFCDLIDIVFKQQMINQKSEFSQQIINYNSILDKYKFCRFKFTLLLALESLSDIHPIIWQQLIFLTKNKRFTTILKIKHSQSLLPEQFTSTNRPFESLINEMLNNSNQIAKIYVCGPLKMSQTLEKLLQNQNQVSYSII